MSRWKCMKMAIECYRFSQSRSGLQRKVWDTVWLQYLMATVYPPAAVRAREIHETAIWMQWHVYEAEANA